MVSYSLPHIILLTLARLLHAFHFKPISNLTLQPAAQALQAAQEDETENAKATVISKLHDNQTERIKRHTLS